MASVSGLGVELDEIFDALDPNTRKAFRTWQQEPARSVTRRGRDLNDALGNLPAFAANAADVLEVLDEQRAGARGVVRDTGVVFGALTQNEGSLRALVTDDTAKVFTAIHARQREALGRDVADHPDLPRRIQATFNAPAHVRGARTEAADAELKPAARDLAPAVRDVRGRLAAGPQEHLRGPRSADHGLQARSAGDHARCCDGLRAAAAPSWARSCRRSTRSCRLDRRARAHADRTCSPTSAWRPQAKVDVPRPAGGTGHYLRQFGPLGTESDRDPAQRAPRATAATPTSTRSACCPRRRAQKFKILPSFDCNNSGEKEPGGEPATPGCRIQKPFQFKGSPTTRYPQLRDEPY